MPVVGVRSRKRLPSCSSSISCSRSRSRRMSSHSAAMLCRWRRSSSSLTSSRARKEQNTWPRMAMSLLFPFGCDVVPVEAILEFLDEQQGKEGAEHVAANGHVAAVVDWASGKHGLGLAEQLLDPQQVAIAQHDLKRGELGVGAQHIEPVKARVCGDPRLVHVEVLGRDGLEIAAETAVADER